MKAVRLSTSDARDATRRVLALVDQLVAIRLIELHCRAHKPMSGDVDEITLVTRLGAKAEVQGADLVTYSQYQVAAIIDDDADAPTPENTVWTVNATFGAHWALSGEPTGQDAQCFAISQGALTCHPYARETIQSATARMGYPPATIDLLFDPWSGGSGEIEIVLPESGN